MILVKLIYIFHNTRFEFDISIYINNGSHCLPNQYGGGGGAIFQS